MSDQQTQNLRQIYIYVINTELDLQRQERRISSHSNTDDKERLLHNILILGYPMYNYRSNYDHWYCIYCRMGFIHPCFNFAHLAQLTVGEFKTRANNHSHIECIVNIETEVIHEWAKKR